MLEKTTLIFFFFFFVKWLLTLLKSEIGSRSLALPLNKDIGSRAQTCSSDKGSNVQSAVRLVCLLEANITQAKFCGFLMEFC